MSFLIAATATWACGSRQPSGGFTISGNATYDATASVASREFSAQALLIVDSTGSVLGQVCPKETQHLASFRLRTGPEGDYQLTLSRKEFTPVSHPLCPLETLEGATVRTIRLNATVGAPEGSCTEFCQRRESESADTCRADCDARRELRASARASGDEIAALPTATVARLPLEFSEWAPKSSSGGTPDLRVDAATAAESWSVTEREFEAGSCALHEGCLTAAGARRLLTFDTAIVNGGEAALEIGDPHARDTASFDSCHGHYHLGGIMSYELIAKDGAIVATGRKQGFCLMDSARFGGESPARFDCDEQGISAGWADIYDRSLDCQWIDVTDVAPGEYRLRLRVNPDLELTESDYGNNSTEVEIHLTEGTAP